MHASTPNKRAMVIAGLDDSDDDLPPNENQLDQSTIFRAEEEKLPPESATRQSVVMPVSREPEHHKPSGKKF